MVIMTQLELLANYKDVIAAPPNAVSCQEIGGIVPYLSESEIRRLLARCTNERTTVRLVGPPIGVQGAYHIFDLIPTGYDPRRHENCAGIRYRYTSRRRVSYQAYNCPAGVRDPTAPEVASFMERAQDYASTHWGENLVWDTSRSVLQAHIVRAPTGSHVARAVVWLSRSYVELYQDDDEPLSQLVNDAIIKSESQVTCAGWSTPTASELQGHHLPWAAFFCAHCGGGVGAWQCHACGAIYDNGLARTQPPTAFPLPRALAAIAPLHFTMPVRRAETLEMEVFLKQRKRMYNLQDAVPTERDTRVIQIED